MTKMGKLAVEPYGMFYETIVNSAENFRLGSLDTPTESVKNREPYIIKIFWVDRSTCVYNHLLQFLDTF